MCAFDGATPSWTGARTRRWRPPPSEGLAADIADALRRGKKPTAGVAGGVKEEEGGYAVPGVTYRVSLTCFADTPPVITTLDVGSARTASLGRLLPGCEYAVCVTAQNNCGVSDACPRLRFLTPSSPPGLVEVVGCDAGEVEVSLRPGSNDSRQYTARCNLVVSLSPPPSLGSPLSGYRVQLRHLGPPLAPCAEGAATWRPHPPRPARLVPAPATPRARRSGRRGVQHRACRRAIVVHFGPRRLGGVGG